MSYLVKEKMIITIDDEVGNDDDDVLNFLEKP
jgi:hypothetical protein